MFCDEVLDAIESIAAGELKPGERVASHLASCPNCAAALDGARHVERMLQIREVPKVSSQFTARTMARVRRERWRREQFVDAGFNLALVVLIAAIVGVVWMILNRSGLVVVGTDAVNLLGFGFAALARRVAPSLPLYLGATALLLSALALWWWAEREAPY